MNKQYATADLTRRRIIKAATTLFVQKGFAATSISQIAKKANINQSLIYHHYENKEELWRRVKDDIMSSQMSEDFVTHFQSLNGKQFIQHYLEGAINIMTTSKNFRRLLMWQYLEPPKKQLHRASAFRDPLITLIKNLQKKNELTTQQPAEFILMVLSQLAGPYLFEQTIYPLSDNQQLKTYTDFIINQAESMFLRT